MPTLFHCSLSSPCRTTVSCRSACQLVKVTQVVWEELLSISADSAIKIILQLLKYDLLFQILPSKPQSHLPAFSSGPHALTCLPALPIPTCIPLSSPCHLASTMQPCLSCLFDKSNAVFELCNCSDEALSMLVQNTWNKRDFCFVCFAV